MILFNKTYDVDVQVKSWKVNLILCESKFRSKKTYSFTKLTIMYKINLFYGLIDILFYLHQRSVFDNRTNQKLHLIKTLLNKSKDNNRVGT